MKKASSVGNVEIPISKILNLSLEDKQHGSWYAIIPPNGSLLGHLKSSVDLLRKEKLKEDAKPPKLREDVGFILVKASIEKNVVRLNYLFPVNYNPKGNEFRI